MSWRDDAACRDMGPALFYDNRGGAGNFKMGRVREICGTCPVRIDCLTYALEAGERDGAWGGLTERERRKMRGQIRRGTFPIIDGVELQVTLRPTNNQWSARCGTKSGHDVHRRNGEQPCAPCLKAQADYSREWRLQKKLGEAS